MKNSADKVEKLLNEMPCYTGNHAEVAHAASQLVDDYREAIQALKELVKESDAFANVLPAYKVSIPLADAHKVIVKSMGENNE